MRQVAYYTGEPERTPMRGVSQARSRSNFYVFEWQLLILTAQDYPTACNRLLRLLRLSQFFEDFEGLG